MAPIQSFDVLLYTIAAGILMWLGKIIGAWFDEATKERRERTDKLAKAETRTRLLTESLHEHRNVMLKSGHWSRDTLPPFIKE